MTPFPFENDAGLLADKADGPGAASIPSDYAGLRDAKTLAEDPHSLGVNRTFNAVPAGLRPTNIPRGLWNGDSVRSSSTSRRTTSSSMAACVMQWLADKHSLAMSYQGQIAGARSAPNDRTKNVPAGLPVGGSCRMRAQRWWWWLSGAFIEYPLACMALPGQAAANERRLGID